MAATPGAGTVRGQRYLLLLISSATSAVGDGFTSVALAFAVLASLDSPSALGAILAARVIPAGAFALLGGALADRRSRSSQMAVAHLISFAMQALVFIELVSGHPSVWRLAAAYAVFGTAQALFRPAASAIMPSLVVPEQLQRANGLLMATTSAAGLAGPALAGLLLVVWDPTALIAVDAGTFLVSALLLIRIREPLRRSVAPGTFRDDVRNGLSLVLRTRWLRAMISYFSLYQFVMLGLFYVLGPSLTADATRWGWALTALGAGSLAGALAAARISPRRPLVGTLAASCLALPSLALLGPVGTVPLLCLMFAHGLGLAVGGTLWETTLQSRVDSELLGRVSAVDWFGSLALRPLGLASAGPLATLMGARSALLIGAVVVLLSALATLPAAREDAGATPAPSRRRVAA